jgi:hypothetical protein
LTDETAILADVRDKLSDENDKLKQEALKKTNELIDLKWEIKKGLKLNPYFIYRPDYGKATYNRLFYIYGLQLDYSIR